MRTAPFELKWGVLTSSDIGAAFCRDVLISPATRGVTDVLHRLVAVGTRSPEESAKFVRDQLAEAASGLHVHGDFADLMNDCDVDVVYIATLYSDHFENAVRCLEAGKHVLMDKPCTVNAGQARVLMQLAKEKKLFLMEGVWTQFLPIAEEVRRLVDTRAIGRVKHVDAAFMINVGDDDADVTNRFHDHSTGGGSLLDLGPYPWTWIYLTLYRSLYGPPAAWDDAFTLPQIVSTATVSRTNVDESVAALMSFPPPRSLGLTNGNLKSSLTTAAFHTSMAFLPPSSAAAVTVFGTEGTLSIGFPTSRPTVLTVETFSLTRLEGVAPLSKQNPSKIETAFDIPAGARGYTYELDEVARCIREGKLESEILPWKATLLSMEIFDEIRRQNGLAYPKHVESCVL